MKFFIRKINNQKGASILLALMLFFVCFMVAAVILSSATANADKLRQRESNQKEYLAVSSAANLLRDVFGGLKYTGWEKKTVYSFQNYSSDITNVGSQPDEVLEICPNIEYEAVNARIRYDLATMVYAVYLSHTQYVEPKPVPSKFFPKEFVISGAGMEEVKVSMALDEETYDITCFLTLNDTTEENNAMTVVFKAGIHIDDPPKENHYTDEAITYEECVDNDDGTKTSTKEYNISEYKINTIITYDGGTVTSGVLH